MGAFIFLFIVLFIGVFGFLLYKIRQTLLEQTNQKLIDIESRINKTDDTNELINIGQEILAISEKPYISEDNIVTATKLYRSCIYKSRGLPVPEK